MLVRGIKCSPSCYVRSARVSILCVMPLFLYLRARTVLTCVLMVFTDQAACPPAPAIIRHPAHQPTAPASAEKVGCSSFMISPRHNLSSMKTLCSLNLVVLPENIRCSKNKGHCSLIYSISMYALHSLSAFCILIINKIQ